MTTVDCRQSPAAPHRAAWGVLLPSLHRSPPLWRQHGCRLAEAGQDGRVAGSAASAFHPVSPFMQSVLTSFLEEVLPSALGWWGVQGSRGH